MTHVVGQQTRNRERSQSLSAAGLTHESHDFTRAHLNVGIGDREDRLTAHVGDEGEPRDREDEVGSGHALTLATSAAIIPSRLLSATFSTLCHRLWSGITSIEESSREFSPKLHEIGHYRDRAGTQSGEGASHYRLGTHPSAGMSAGLRFVAWSHRVDVRRGGVPMVESTAGTALDDDAAVRLYENPTDEHRALLALLADLPSLTMPDDVIASISLALADARGDEVIDLRPIDLREDRGASVAEPAVLRRESTDREER